MSAQPVSDAFPIIPRLRDAVLSRPPHLSIDMRCEANLTVSRAAASDAGHLLKQAFRVGNASVAIVTLIVALSAFILTFHHAVEIPVAATVSPSMHVLGLRRHPNSQGSARHRRS